MTDTFKDKFLYATRHIRKLRNYKEKCQVADLWDEELGPIVVDEAHTVGLPLDVALALVEVETGPFDDKNVFGCNYGSPFCNDTINRSRMETLLKHIGEGGKSTGVGPTQIADPPYIYKAELLGGAHIPRNSMRVGFKILKRLVEKYDVEKAFIYYNGGEGSNSEYAENTYGPKAMHCYKYYKEELESIGD